MNNWLDTNSDTLIGDFNCALNSNLNRFNCVSSGDIGKVDIQQLMQQHNLEDVWRNRFPDKKEYSWQRGSKASRIDYWLISTSLDSQIEYVGYRQCAMSDHKLVEMSMRTSETAHGMGFWKMNSDEMQLKLFHDCFTNSWKDWKGKKVKHRNLGVWWDMGKKKNQRVSLWCSHKLKQNIETMKINLEK